MGDVFPRHRRQTVEPSIDARAHNELNLPGRRLPDPPPLRMKKLLLFIIALGLAGALGKVLWNTWETTAIFHAEGREATLKVGKKYNTSHWSSPLPIKKIHVYTATMAEKYDVLIETDQALDEKATHTIRFLLRDRAAVVRQMSIRPLVGTIRLRAKEDGTPVTIKDTDLFERILAKAIGPLGDGVKPKAQPVAEAAPNLEVPSVPFLIAPPNAPIWRIAWENGTVGEGVILIVWILIVQWLLVNASNQPWRPNAAKRSEKDNFVHPSMRRIDADTPAAASQKIAYTPKPRKPGPTETTPSAGPSGSDAPLATTPSEIQPEPTPERPQPTPLFPPPSFTSRANAQVDTPAETPAPPQRKITLPFKPKSPETQPPVPHSTATTAPFIPQDSAPKPNLTLRKKPTE